MSFRSANGRKNKNYRTSKKPSWLRLTLEPLEDRLTPAAPTVVDSTLTSLTPTSAVLGGQITADGGQLVINRGVVFSLTSKNADPTLNGHDVTAVLAPPDLPNLTSFLV